MVPNNSLLRPTHSMADYLYTFHLLHHHQHMGRYNLAQQLKISSAKTRIILQKLAEAKLVEKSSQRLGHQLSSHGKEVWKRFQQFLHIPTRRIHLGSNYTLGEKDAIVCVEGTGIEKLNSVVLRDEALLNGAMGCTVFLKDQSGHFFLLDAVYPPLPHTALSDRKARRKLTTTISGISWSKIVIIVGTANHVINAQIGAIAAALLLVPEEIKQYFKDFL